MSKLSDFVRGYLETALWSSTDNTDDQGGEPLDANYCLADFTDEAVKEAEEVCREFLEACEAEGLSGSMKKRQEGQAPLDSWDGGYDLWLTSVGHGAGFWDGDWQNGERLTLEAKEAGLSIQGVYVGDDKLLYFHG